MDLQEKIGRIITNSRKNSLPSARLAPENYSAAFRDSSIEKAKRVLETVIDLKLNQKSVIYVSIGSSECYEIEYMLKNSEIERFVGFDISHKACQMAWERLADSIPPKQLTLISGDALHNTAELHGYIRELTRSPNDIVLISMHGILHEIIREKVFELEGFLSSLCQRYQRLLLYIREPCEPINLPENVLLGFGAVRASELMHFGQLVASRLGIDTSVSVYSDSMILCGRQLAGEVIVKLFYIDDFDYEIQERITAVNPTELASLVLTIDSNFVIEQSLLNSASYQRNFHRDVRLLEPKNRKPLLPLAFTRIIAKKGF